MEAVFGPIAAKLDANVRVVRGTCMVPGTVNTSTQFDVFVALPAAANGVFLGAASEDRFETGFKFDSNTDPTTVTGTTPAAPYNLQAKPIGLVRRGRFPLIAAGAIALGVYVKIGDAFGRVTAVGGEAAGTVVQVVGQALNVTGTANDIVEVDIAPFAYTHN